MESISSALALYTAALAAVVAIALRAPRVCMRLAPVLLGICVATAVLIDTYINGARSAQQGFLRAFAQDVENAGRVAADALVGIDTPLDPLVSPGIKYATLIWDGLVPAYLRLANISAAALIFAGILLAGWILSLMIVADEKRAAVEAEAKQAKAEAAASNRIAVAPEPDKGLAAHAHAPQRSGTETNA